MPRKLWRSSENFMIKIEIIKDKKNWEKFLLSQKRQPFFQSWGWGEIQENLGNQILRLGIFEEREKRKKLVGLCLVVEVKARRGHFFHLRHGPVFSTWQKKYFNPLMSFLKIKAREQGISFMRISPLIPGETKLTGFLPAPIHNQDAETCWVLDLEKSEEQLLKEMRKTTRYLIKKGERQGFEIMKTQNPAEISLFLPLYQKTAQKHGFVPHRGIREEFKIFTNDNQALLILAKFKKRIISGALILFYGNQAIYHHGATDPAFEQLSPSYLLQWEAIKEAKARGKKVYNFWGIAPEEKLNHPWKGLSLFKKGFGGRKEEFLHAQDLPLKPNYWLTFTIETFRRLARGY